MERKGGGGSDRRSTRQQQPQPQPQQRKNEQLEDATTSSSLSTGTKTNQRPGRRRNARSKTMTGGGSNSDSNSNDNNNNNMMEPDRRRILLPGKPDMERCDNRVISARYTALSFFPMAIYEQFRRFANLYFLCVGMIMAVGYYNPNLYESAIVPWTTLGPLMVVISFSLMVEGNADLRRHANDRQTNDEAKCIVLTRRQDLTPTTSTVSLATLNKLLATTATTTTDLLLLRRHLPHLRPSSLYNTSAAAPTTDSGPASAAAGTQGGNRNNINYEGVNNDPTGKRAIDVLKGHDVKVNINKSYNPASSPSRKRKAPRTVGGGEVGVSRRTVGPLSSSPALMDDAPSPLIRPSEYVHIAFQRVSRADVRQGHFVLVRNREMVPADMIVLASSNDSGSAYIETSSIDGETNLKLRCSPRMPKAVRKALEREYSDSAVPSASAQVSSSSGLEPIHEEEQRRNSRDQNEGYEVHIESIEEAVKRLARLSYLGRPDAESVLKHPWYKQKYDWEQQTRGPSAHPHFGKTLLTNLESSFRDFVANVGEVTQPLHYPFHHYRHLSRREGEIGPDSSPVICENRYIAALITEPPNPSVHTFQGKLVLPPFDSQQQVHELPLDTENVLLRGAVLRNTEWIIGVAFFTGTDTKLVQNSVKTRSKFSQMDRLMNQTVLVILGVMVSAISYLATMAVRANQEQFDDLWYVGYNANTTDPWPYLPHLDPPKWKTQTRNWIQFFLLYVTLLTNFIPLSLYISVEFVTFCMLGFVHNDLAMYDETSNTRAVARSTNITDLGRIQYIFSDKTGTLTQNVMHFKRCSVDGLAFGAPIQKWKPSPNNQSAVQLTTNDEKETESSKPSPQQSFVTPFHPLRHLLVGRLLRPSVNVILPTSGLRAPHQLETIQIASDRLTFNAEMFLRVMSLCHTVVVEKDLDRKKGKIARSGRCGRLVHSKSDSTFASLQSAAKFIGMGHEEVPSSIDELDVEKNASLSETKERSDLVLPNSDDDDNAEDDDSDTTYYDATLASAGSWEGLDAPFPKSSPDGAPFGFAYQAESPDEGALVSAASSIYGFQVVIRDSHGITLRVSKPSHLEDAEIVNGLKNRTVSLKRLAADTALDLASRPPVTVDENNEQTDREETWAILAVNKFDSDRKRMSMLLRSPPELGSIPILFCKGADTAMLDPRVCENGHGVQQPTSEMMMGLDDVAEEVDPYDEWELSQMLSLRAHLGDFASEGLRTLVLGLRILTEDECSEWLVKYKAASISLANRSELLTEAALAIETNLHVVGATAIEDRLQEGVPDTIATLGKAGIKLWVLTGDKRETAVEIGYSTNVLTPSMHVTEVTDLGELHVRTQVSMEFLSLVKRGKLPEYQKAQISESQAWSFKKMIHGLNFSLGKCFRSIQRSMERMFSALLYKLSLKEKAEWHFFRVARNLDDEAHIIRPTERRRNVRTRAEAIINEWLESDEGKAQRKVGRHFEEDLSMVSDDTPEIFRNAMAARSLLSDIKESGRFTHASLREVSLASLTAHEANLRGNVPLVDEDTLSMESFCPGNLDDSVHYFDEKRRTFLERAFAIDRDVRKGWLRKHVVPEKLAEMDKQGSAGIVRRKGSAGAQIVSGPRALVIEGAALKYLLGDPELEEILFSVAHTCDAVIACRVSPKQKALLVSLVRHNVTPKPTTLAIGDGANDVGMIQEANVGVGISGKEGQQAVNASDFAIAQFRFLEELILIHGRWNFFRLSTVVLFSFYKNAVLAGALITFASQTVYSGTSLFDQWLIAMLNFVAGIPIIMTGLFDRCLSKEYVRRHPEVYKASQDNELITKRILLRWIGMVFIHLFTLYYFTIPAQSYGGGMTSAFDGLMGNKERDEPGNGEGGDLKSTGTVTFTCMIFLLAYKVLYESKSLIHGIWPAFTCRKGKGEGVWSRLAYTWISVTYFSIGFYFWAINTYQLIGRLCVSSLSSFVDVVNHVLGARSLSWMLIAFVPIFGMVFDVSLKVYSNLFFPTQTQIHREIESKERE
ncbi:hypothetical protein ACA910_009770 [Epithemia clementina (nom. ined.)]